MSEALMQLVGVSAGYDGRTILREVFFEVASGECLAIIGPNGSGKTTLLKVMSGALAPAAGAVRLEGRALAEWPVRERARRMAFVSQEHERFFALSVREAVMAGRTPYLSRFGWESPEDRRVTQAVLDRMGLEGLAERWLHELSSGERQRVWMAAALAQEPKLIFLDEPTSHLDLRYQIEVMERTEALRREGVAIVWVSHDLNLAARYGTRLLAIFEGAVIASGSPEEVIREEIVARLYGPRAAVERARDGLPIVVPKKSS